MPAGRPAWNPGFLPTRTPLDRYQCRHGMGYTVFDSEKDGLQAQITCFVPLGETCELHDLVLTNQSQEVKTVQVYGCVEWCLWNAVDDGQNYQRNLNVAESEAEPGVIYHKTEYRERRASFVLGYAKNPRDQKFIAPNVIRKDEAHRVLAKFASFDAA